MRNKKTVIFDGAELTVAGNPELQSFAVYRGDGCVMRGKLADGKIWIEYGAIELNADLYAAAVESVAEPDPAAPEPPAPPAPETTLTEPAPAEPE